MTRFSMTFIAAVVALSALPAPAQNYPTKPIRIISTQTAPSPADGVIRLAAQKMNQSMGHPILVDIQAGAAGVLAAQAVARAAPDGYTILYTLASTMVTTPQVMKNKSYELKDFTPIIAVSQAATCMLASVQFKPNTVTEFIAYARANPGKLAYGTNGVGGTYHLEMELLKQKYGLDLTHVPYKSGVDSMMAAVANILPIAYAPCAPAISQAHAGKLKILALLDTKRLPDLPDIPAMGESVPDYEKLGGGSDIYGPAGLPPPILKRLHAELVKALTSLEVRDYMKKVSYYHDGVGLDEMAAQRRKNIEITARAIKIAGIQPE